jgi:hypothetical protein
VAQRNGQQIHQYYGGSGKEKKGQENEKEKIITGFNGEVTSLTPSNPHPAYTNFLMENNGTVEPKRNNTLLPYKISEWTLPRSFRLKRV